jgi:hypothetical protein
LRLAFVWPAALLAVTSCGSSSQPFQPRDAKACVSSDQCGTAAQCGADHYCAPVCEGVDGGTPCYWGFTPGGVLWVCCGPDTHCCATTGFEHEECLPLGEACPVACPRSMLFCRTSARCLYNDKNSWDWAGPGGCAVHSGMQGSSCSADCPADAWCGDNECCGAGTRCGDAGCCELVTELPDGGIGEGHAGDGGTTDAPLD